MIKQKKPLPESTSIALMMIFFLIPLWTCFSYFLYSKTIAIVYFLTFTITTIPLLFMAKQFREIYLLKLFYSNIALISMIIGICMLALSFLTYSKVNISTKFVWVALFVIYSIYLGLVLQFYIADYLKNTKKRLASFDFDASTYDWATKTLIYQDAFCDFYFKSSLSKVHIFLIRIAFAGIATGSFLAIIIGKISANLQLIVGLLAIHFSLMFFIQLLAPAFYSFLQVVRLQIKYRTIFKIINN